MVRREIRLSFTPRRETVASNFVLHTSCLFLTDQGDGH